jgi:hypothetical protein
MNLRHDASKQRVFRFTFCCRRPSNPPNSRPLHRISSGVATSILICSYVSDFTIIALLLLFVCFGSAAPPEVWFLLTLACLLWPFPRDTVKMTPSVCLFQWIAETTKIEFKANRWNYAQIAETILKSLKLILLKVKNDWNWKFPKIDAPQPIFLPKKKTCTHVFWSFYCNSQNGTHQPARVHLFPKLISSVTSPRSSSR